MMEHLKKTNTNKGGDGVDVKNVTPEEDHSESSSSAKDLKKQEQEKKKESTTDKTARERLILALLSPDPSAPGAIVGVEAGSEAINEPPSSSSISNDPPMLTLERNSVQSREVLPGAYRGHGATAQRVNSTVSNVSTNSAIPASTTNYDNAPVANPVNDIEGAAEPVDTQERATAAASRHRKDVSKVACILAAFSSVILAVVLIIVFVGLDKGNFNQTDAPPPPTELISPEKQLQAALSPHTLEQIENIPYSPQARAYEWIKADPFKGNYTMTRSLQRFSLATFYYSTGGPGWSNNTGWLDYTVHECDWAFVPPPTANPVLWQYNQAFMEKAASVHSPCALDYYTNETGEEYRHLWYFFNNLQGSLPPELSLLTSLVNLVLSSNELQGPIPTQLGSMQQLQEVWLFRNKLSGTIPLEISSLSGNLASLLLASNHLTGTIPAALGNLTNLKFLRLSTNLLTGTIPTELTLLHQNLIHLFLMENDLTGTLPSQLGKLQKLQFLLLDNNRLHGPIPSELGHLTALNWLTLYKNQFTGTIPTELGKLTQMDGLTVESNELNGTIPSELAELTLLTFGGFAENDFTGTLPEGLGDLDVAGVSFGGNDLSGSVPSSFCNLTHPWAPSVFNCSRDRLCGCDCPCSDSDT